MKNKISVILCAFLLVLSSVFTNVQANEESVVTQTENHEKAQTFEAAKNGLQLDQDHVWRYYQNGQVDVNYTGLVQYWGTWYYIENGVLNWGYTGLTNYYGTWYYVEQGRLNWGYTGLTNYYGTWYYVEQGRLNWGYTGLTKYYDTWYYVEQGRLNWGYTGLTNYYGTWYYVAQGILNWNYSGIVQWNNENWRVTNGVATEKVASHIVCIDAGHQAYGISQKEPNGPGSSVMKAMLTTGSAGIVTRQPEYKSCCGTKVKS